MATSTHDLSTATEDELLRGMRPRLHAAHLAARCVCVSLDAFSDSILFFVFLSSAVYGLEMPSSKIYADADFPLLSAVICAVCYGSQHLRWRGEWLLMTAYGMTLQFLCHQFGGRLVTPLCGAMAFATFRYLRRSQDVRRFHSN